MSVQCNGQLLRSPEHGRINCPELTSWIAEAGERCRLECDSGYTPSIERITCYDYGWSIPSSNRVKASQKVSCVSGGATTMLIIGLLVGGLILICIIAFAYAKFSDRRTNHNDDDESDDGSKCGKNMASNAARRAAMEETVQSGKLKEDKKNKKNGKKMIENPTNKFKQEKLVGANMIDPNGAYARNSPDSYTSGFPLMMSSSGMGHPPQYEFRTLSPASFQTYESFMLPQQMPIPKMQSNGLQRHSSMSPGVIGGFQNGFNPMIHGASGMSLAGSCMAGPTTSVANMMPGGAIVPSGNYPHIGPSGMGPSGIGPSGMGPGAGQPVSRNLASQSFGAYDHVTFQNNSSGPKLITAGGASNTITAGIKSKSFSPDGYHVPI